MKWLIIDLDKNITNIIEADETVATNLGAKEYYTGANISDMYDPPTMDNLQLKINALLLEKKQRESQMAQADDAAIAMFEAQAKTDDAILAIYEKIGG